MTVIAFPKNIIPYTASWDNIGDSDETLKVQWNDPVTGPGLENFIVGTHVFLETATNTSQVPDDHLISSIRMAAILAGQVLPGTEEYLAAVSEQATKYFQTIIGNVTVKTVAPVSDSGIGPEGTVFDITFNKVGSGTNTKTVRVDAWTLSQYQDGTGSMARQAMCIPGSLHKALALKKSDLGVANSANRNAVIAHVAAQRFWV